MDVGQSALGGRVGAILYSTLETLAADWEWRVVDDRKE